MLQIEQLKHACPQHVPGYQKYTTSHDAAPYNGLVWVSEEKKLAVVKVNQGVCQMHELQLKMVMRSIVDQLFVSFGSLS